MKLVETIGPKALRVAPDFQCIIFPKNGSFLESCTSPPHPPHISPIEKPRGLSCQTPYKEGFVFSLNSWPRSLVPSGCLY